jgi:hypothetical protein
MTREVMWGTDSAETFLANVKSRQVLPSGLDDSVTQSGLDLKNGVFWDVTPFRRNIPEDAILHSHRRENLKSYTG